MAEGASLAEQRESMDTGHAAAAAAQDAAAAQKRWRAFASKVAPRRGKAALRGGAAHPTRPRTRRTSGGPRAKHGSTRRCGKGRH